MKLKYIAFIFTIIINYTHTIKAQENISLTGKWYYKVDSLNIGEKESWEKKIFTQVIFLPGSTDEVGIGNEFPLFKSLLGIEPLKNYPKNADFGMLTRKHKYLGKVWYQKKINISPSSNNKNYQIFLEKIMWRSRIWLDGKEINSPIDLLNSPHIYNLTNISEGEHMITILIDNSMIYPIGELGHSYCPHMQSQWNGVIGQMYMVEKPNIYIEHINVFPSYKEKKANVKIELTNNINQQNIALLLKIKSVEGNKTIHQKKYNVTLSTGKQLYSLDLNNIKDILGWDEFQPNLYQLEARVILNKKELNKKVITFGFRDLGTKDKHFTINDRKIIYRNSHEGLFFGKTGYPAMDVPYWRDLWKLYKKHGFNAVRFHSSCPPEAAFIAADELGIYLQVEFFWMDGWMRYKNLIGEKDTTLNNYIRYEFENALKYYSNHPSLMLIAFGNELGGNFNKMSSWIGEYKKKYPNHFYCAGIAHNVTENDDYVEYGGKHKSLDHNGTDWDYTSNYTTAKEHYYDKNYLRKNLPEFTHETGQYVVHPLWSEINKYTGVFDARNLKYYKTLAEQNGISSQDSLFQLASGEMNKMLYKSEIEATLRTPQSAGYSLLSMVDYPGQGEALIGWVDPFYENKKFLPAKEYRRFGNHTVPLLRFSKYVWEDKDIFNCKIEVANFGPNSLLNKKVKLTLTQESKILKDTTFNVRSIIQGDITKIGNFSHILNSGESGIKIVINLEIIGTEHHNSWEIWVLPKKNKSITTDGIIVTSSLDKALENLKKGAKVLLQADKLGDIKNTTNASFSPVFWSATWFNGQETSVSGAVIDSRHPALKWFPTSNVMNWLWKDVCENGRGFILNDLPKSYFPIVQPVNDFHFGNKIGTIFEFKTKEGGRLLICGYNITDSLNNRPSSRQLRASLLDYMNTNLFNPKQIIEYKWLKENFFNNEDKFIKESKTNKYLLYIKPGGYFTKIGSTKWDPKLDIVKEEGYKYTVNSGEVYQDESGSYWIGKHISLDIEVKNPNLMNLKIDLNNLSENNYIGIIKCEDIPDIKFDSKKEKSITIPISRENCLDGKIKIEIESQQNIMVEKLILESI